MEKIVKLINNMITKDIIPDLYTFPIVMVDGENEEKKRVEKEQRENLGLQSDEDVEPEYDIVYGEACYPYYDFRGIEDRWLPTQTSLRKALKSRFDSCLVRFDNAGSFLVPMSKKQFLEDIGVFITKRKLDITNQVNVLLNDSIPESGVGDTEVIVSVD